MKEGEGGYGGVTVLLAFLGGAAVGAALALLLAPRSGAEARRRLAGKAGEVGDAVSRGAKVAREAALAAEAAFTSAMAEEEPQAATGRPVRR
ncbi:MAG: YtxH domain-containing protein [Anaeromyxobacteraceae bacterium]